MQVNPLSSLRFRLIASVLAIEVVMLSIMVWNTVDSIYRTHTERLSDTASSLVQQFADIAGSYMVEVDYASLEEYASHVLNHREVAYVVVQNLDGQTVLALGSTVPAPLPPTDTHPTQVDDGVYDATTDILLAGRPQGRVQIGFSLDLMHTAIRQARNRAIAIAATEVVLSTLVIILLGMYLTRHLRALAEAAVQVGEGRYDVVLPVSSRDEIGLTAQAFNTMVADIAERTHRLEENRNRIHLLMDSTAEAIVGVSEERRCMFVNKACVRMLGYDSEADILGRDFHELAHHSYEDGSPYPSEECSIRVAMEHSHDGIVHIQDETFWRADGSHFPIDAWTYPIIEDGRRNGYMVTFIDVSERQATERALSRSQAEFEAMFNAIGDAVIFTDRQRRVVMLNPAVQTLFGHQPEELLGQSTEKLYADSREFAELGRQDASGERHRVSEVLCRHRDGSLFWTESIDTPVTDHRGVVIGHIRLVRDISERKQAADELLRHRDRLEEMVRARTWELENSNRELESFAYSVSHDLRAPLRHIDGYSLALLEDYAHLLDEEGRDFLQRMRHSAQYMGELIDDMLALSRVTRSDLRLEDVDLSRLAQEILDRLENAGPPRTVEIRIQAGLHVQADRRLLEIALTNLLGNAWKYTARTARPRISLEASEASGTTVYQIRDNGAGFDMQYADKLFTPFQRLHPGEEFEGTGVGLAIASRVIHRHGGRIWAEGVIGEGATFHFTLRTT